MEFIQNLTQFDQLIVTELAHLSHKMEIGNRKTDSNWENRFYSQLFRNVGLRVNMIYSKKKTNKPHLTFRAFQVEKNKRDATTTIEICFDDVSNFTHFHELCAAATISMKNSLGIGVPIETAGNKASTSNVDESRHDSRAPIAPIEKPSSNGNDGTSSTKRKSTDMDSTDLETYVLNNAALFSHLVFL